MQSMRAGQIVICRDNESVERYVEKNSTYFVEKVSHRGSLINLRGVAITLAAARFVPAMAPGNPNEMVVANASNQ